MPTTRTACPTTTTTGDDRPRAFAGRALAAAVLGFFVITLDAVIVNVALPSIRYDVGGGITGLQWVVDGYTLMFAALLLSSGSLADRVGARRAFGIGVAIFALASAACGLAPNLGALVAARLVQGAAAAVMMPSSMALIGHAYPDPVRRGRAVAVWAMGGLTYGAIEAGAAGFAAPRVIAAFAVAGVALAAFLAAQALRAHPMVPLDLFASRTATVSVVVGFAFIVGYYGLPFVMSLYLQQLRGLSALAAGAAFVPMMLIGAILTPFSARIAERIGTRALISTGLALMTAGLAILALVPASTPVWVHLMVPIGLSGPLVMPPMTAALLNAVPPHRAGVAGGVFNTSRQVGGALAVAVFGALLAQPAGFLHGLRSSLLIAAAASLAAAAASLLLRPAPTATTGRTHDQP
ncbi:MFS transporter [Nonomuraea angiospora]|uniref:MFS transporter n=1 Tax=Nonomuraea angiospora TaxID=46172 RepID=UPI0037AD701C